MDAFVSQWYAAPVVAALVLSAGLALLYVRRSRTATLARWGLALLGWPIVLLGLLLLVGATAAQVGWSRFNAAHPAPGKLVDVGGYRIHVLCEGPATPATAAAPTVLWLPGGYGQGWWMKHLHDGIKAERRSCLIDRAGTGWSDPGPSPRRVQTLVQEFAKALDGAGERAPLVIVGHSLGGVLAANFAALHPQRVAGIVTLDPTPQTLLPEAVRYWIGTPEPSTFKAWAVQLGATTLVPALNPLNTAAWQNDNAALKPNIEILAKLEERPTSLLASSPAAYWTMADAHGVIRQPGALGALPLLSIVQAQDPDDPKLLEMSRRWMQLNNDFEVQNWRAIARAAQREYPAFSSRGVLKTAPVGATHNFPIEKPDFVLAEVRQFISTLPTSP
jgi:pimeloyl-ACP methyl ester carboxylesterase